MNPIEVVFADDSAVARRTITALLNDAPDVELVAALRSGEQVLELLPAFRPDILILDVEMPGIGGLETLRQVRKYDATLPVLMFSAHTSHGVQITVEALTLGASDYLAKIDASDSDNAIRSLQENLLAKIRALGAGPEARSATPPKPTSRMTSRTTSRRRSKASAQAFELLVLGTSTGGPNALAEVIPSLPGDFPVPILIVQHMPASFIPLLAQRLDRESPLQVREAEAGIEAVPGEVWIAPGDHHMTVARRLTGTGIGIELNTDPPVQSCRPAVDPLFISAAKHFGKNTLGVMLTGMGHDGLDGSRAIHDAGGVIVAQDESTSVVWGMPGSVCNAELAHHIEPISRVANVCVQLCTGTKVASKAGRTS